MPRTSTPITDHLRYIVYVAWLHGNSAAMIAKASGTLKENQVKKIIAASPYRRRTSLAHDRRQQFLADMVPLRGRLGPKINPRLFCVSPEIPTTDAPLVIPRALYPEASCLDEILAQHFGIIGDYEAQDEANDRARRPGRQGRSQILERYGDTDASIDINSSLYAYMVNRDLFGDPQEVLEPISMAGTIRRFVVEQFIQFHELREISPVGTPELGVFVDGGGGKEALTFRKMEAMQAIGRWIRAESDYGLMHLYFIADGVEPRDVFWENVRRAIDGIALVDGRITGEQFRRRWNRIAA